MRANASYPQARFIRRRGSAWLVLLAAGCSNSKPEIAVAPAPSSKPAGEVVLQSASVTATVNSTRFVSREHFLAAGEMQISGEPLAEAMGRDLASYNRNSLPTDLNFDTTV